MRYRLAHSKEIKRNRWNKICPICKQPKFSPYIDTVTMRPVDDRQCGRCNRLSNCGYHLPPRMLASHISHNACAWLVQEISQKLHRRKLAATIRRVHSACNTDSKGEATCLREIAFSPFGRRTPFRVQKKVCDASK